MAKRPVLVVHQLFTLMGKHVHRGEVISDPVIMGLVQSAHPEKVTRAMHDVDDLGVETVTYDKPIMDVSWSTKAEAESEA